MNIEKSPLYNSVNMIDDPSYRSMVFYILDKLWKEFYNKRIVGLSDESANRKGYDICYPMVSEMNLLCNHFDITKKQKDTGKVLCYIAPAWMGAQMSKTKIKNWTYLSSYDTYRAPYYQDNGKSQYLMWIREPIEKFGCEDIYPKLVGVLDENTDDIVSILYRVCYIGSIKRR